MTKAKPRKASAKKSAPHATPLERAQALAARLDDAMAEGVLEASGREALFELLMRRFDALEAQRAEVEALIEAFKSAPLELGGLLPTFNQTLGLMLRLADWPEGPLHRLGLGGVALAGFAAWQQDSGPDLAKTMATVDKNLQRLERLLTNLPARI